jgi:hypothetical protein
MTYMKPICFSWRSYHARSMVLDFIHRVQMQRMSREVEAVYTLKNLHHGSFFAKNSKLK